MAATKERKPRRPVKIVLSNGTWFVQYTDRKKHQRYLAAQFYAPDNTLQDVIDWVNARHDLELVEVVE